MPGSSPTVTIMKRPQVDQITGDLLLFMVILDCPKFTNMNIVEIECRVVMRDIFLKFLVTLSDQKPLED